MIVLRTIKMTHTANRRNKTMKNQEPTSKPEGVDEQQREAVLESIALFGVTFKLEIMDADGIVIAAVFPNRHGATIMGHIEKAHNIMEYLGKCMETYRSSSPND